MITNRIKEPHKHYIWLHYKNGILDHPVKKVEISKIGGYALILQTIKTIIMDDNNNNSFGYIAHISIPGDG